MNRKASAVWEGGLKDGRGRLTTESGVLSETAYSFAKRFGDEKGTNPEELIAAAHSGCFSMALSAMLGESGVTPERIATDATVTLEQVPGGFAVTKIHLDVQASIPGMDQAGFEAVANKAKEGCPISKLLKAEITMTARLQS